MQQPKRKSSAGYCDLQAAAFRSSGPKYQHGLTSRHFYVCLICLPDMSVHTRRAIRTQVSMPSSSTHSTEPFLSAHECALLSSAIPPRPRLGPLCFPLPGVQ